MCMISRPAEDNKSYEWRIMCQGADPKKRFFLLQSSFGTTLPVVARGRWRIGTPVRSWWCACCNSSNISAACIVHTGFRRIMINLFEYLQLDISGIVNYSSYVMSHHTPFQEKHKIEFGLAPIQRAPDGTIMTVQCMFCVHIGREKRDGPAVKRQRTKNVQLFQFPFRPECYKSHMQS